MQNNSTKSKISTFIVCMNEEEQIERALKSVSWCDEIIVVDSGSTDNTLELAKKYTDKVIHNDWQGFVEQKRFALGHCSHEWILNIDADEEVSEELKNEIQELLKSNPSANGYEINRVVNFMGKWWRKGGWYPEYRLRLCKKSETTWGGENPHEKALVSGKIKKLKGELFHYTYNNFHDQINTLNKHSSDSAVAMAKRGKKASLIKIFGNPILRFVKFYFFKKGFLEGFTGFIVSILEAYYVYLKYIKLWEINKSSK